MKVGDNIRIVLSCGAVEEGIIDTIDFVEVIENYISIERPNQKKYIHWLILSHKTNANIKLNINKKYIAAYQIENESIKDNGENIKTLTVDDLSLNETVKDPKLRIKKLAELRIEKSNLEKEQ